MNWKSGSSLITNRLRVPLAEGALLIHRLRARLRSIHLREPSTLFAGNGIEGRMGFDQHGDILNVVHTYAADPSR